MAKEEKNPQQEFTAKPGEKVTVDASLIGDLIKSAVSSQVEAALAHRSAQHIEPNDPTMRKLLEADRVNAEPKTTRYLQAYSPRTKSSFTAKVVSSRPFPIGRIVDIGVDETGARDYQEAPEYSKHQGDGGLVPDNIPIRGQDGQLSREYMKWKAMGNNPWIIDLNDFVGKPWNEFFARQNQQALTSPQGV